MTDHSSKFYINGGWVNPLSDIKMDVINPASESRIATISMGDGQDASRAIAAAREAFSWFSRTSKTARAALLRQIIACYIERSDDIASAICDEVGAPLKFAREAQAASGLAHLEATLTSLQNFEFETQRGSTRICYEPIGVAGLITPWNWPLNQIVCKVAPALAAGCTMVLKPSEIAPLSALIFAEILEAAGVPAGVFNLVNGDGPSVGQVLTSHPDVDMVSFTGSTRAGIMVAKSASESVKRVAQELGGKSANIILRDADFALSVEKGVEMCFANSGQSCDAPTRMLVPAERHEEALGVARIAAERHKVGDPRRSDTDLGPVVSAMQYEKIQHLIKTGIDEGATLVAGGLGRPSGLARGYYVRPTVFGNVTPNMRIATEEIFGPVLAILPYDDDRDAIAMANASPFGLAAYVQSQDLDHARDVARQLRVGQVHLNYPDWDLFAPFGGYKQSGNGREYADWGLHDFLEVKGIIGYGQEPGS